MNITPPNIEKYCQTHSTPIAALFEALKEDTIAHTTAPQMQVGMIEGSFLQMLVRLTGAKKVIELGTFTGYSSLIMAEGLADDGVIYTCDVDPRATEIAQKYWAQSPHGKKIQLKLGPALETIPTLGESFDMAFIDADKANYQAYWDLLVPRMRSGGLIVVDNVLWSGRVLQPEDKSDHAIHNFNEYASRDARMQTLMLPIRDGMLLGIKR
jgi:caffeoyl-CoA O-methyltransferase